MILGLDISTSCTGITILDYAGRVILNTCWKFKEEDSFEKLESAKKYIKELKNKYCLLLGREVLGSFNTKEEMEEYIAKEKNIEYLGVTKYYPKY